MRAMTFKTRVIPIHVILIIFSVMAIFPFYYMVITAFKTNDEFYDNIYAPPSSWTFENFNIIVQEHGFARALINSSIVTTASIVLTIAVSVLASYAYSKMVFQGRKFLLSLSVSLTGIPIMIVIIPIYVLLSKAHLLDTYTGVSIVYAAFMLPFSIFILTSFFNSVPNELLNAASIDGCTRFQTLYKIILPLSKPVITTLVIVNSLWVWNDLIIAMMFLRHDRMRTIAVALHLVGGRFALNPVLVQAGALFVAIPMIIMFLFGQRYFTKGLLAGAFKE
jgi:multiple sugar transport system permease protein/raffinose/stachyose/melibiose transport system permease protein